MLICPMLQLCILCLFKAPQSALIGLLTHAWASTTYRDFR